MIVGHLFIYLFIYSFIFVKYFTGIGWASLLISAMVSVYYNVIVMYALLYNFLSLLNIGWPVPWASCDNEWNTQDFCRTKTLPDLASIESITERISASLGKDLFTSG